MPQKLIVYACLPYSGNKKKAGEKNVRNVISKRHGN